MIDLTSLTLAQARDALRRKEFSATELADAHIDAVANGRLLNAFVLETPDRAREMARASEGRLARGEGGPLKDYRSASRICSVPPMSARRRARAFWKTS